MKKKVLFFLSSGVGGAERMTITIAKSLNGSLYNVILYLVDCRFAENPIEKFIPSYIPIKKIENTKSLKLLFKFYDILKEEKPDIVFSSLISINVKLLFLANLYRKTRFIVRNDNYLYTLTLFQKLTIWLSYYKAYAIIAQTDEMKNELLKKIPILLKKRVIVLQNPIDEQTIREKINNPSPYKNKSLIFVASGRFAYEKGFDVLIDAFKIVADYRPDAELYILGDKRGDYYTVIEHKIDSLNLNFKVHCIGLQYNPYIYVKYADCFVLSSRNEGLPNVLIEALYLGTPVAATVCIPIINRIVENSVNGYLARPEDPVSLASAMLKACKLGRVKTNYHPAKIDDFITLFE